MPSLTGGGAERTIVNIANGLNRTKYSVHLLIFDRPASGKYKDEYSHLLYQDIVVHNLGIKICKKNYPRMLLEIGKKITEINPDIVMSTMLRPNIMLTAALILSKYKGKVVLRESTNRTATHVKWVERKIIKYIYSSFADKTIALSQGVKDDLSNNFGVSEKRIQVIYNPADLESIQKLSQEHVNVNEGNIIIAVGRLTAQKDYPTLIKALCLLKNQEEFHMYILGKGELERDIKNEIHNEGLDQYVSMIGFQSNPYKYIRCSDIFVLSSAWEGFGHVVVEAMACGAAVISTDCPYGPNEIITDHVNGILVPVGDYKKIADAIIKILHDSKLKSEMKANAKVRAQDFDRNKIVKQYEILFEELVNTQNM